MSFNEDMMSKFSETLRKEALTGLNNGHTYRMYAAMILAADHMDFLEALLEEEKAKNKGSIKDNCTDVYR